MLSGVESMLLLLVGLSLVLYYYLTSTYDHWKSKGVKGPKPALLFGNWKDVITRKLSIGCFLKKNYKKYENEPYVGIYVCRAPSLIVRDLDLLKDIMIKDFNKFPEHGYHLNEKIEPLLAHLLFLDETRWRQLRPRLTTSFTSAKLKKMFYLLNECAEQLEHCLKKKIEHADNNGEAIVECREFTAKFTTDVVGACIFGLKLDAMTNEDCPFRIMGHRVYHSWKILTLFRLRAAVPKIYDLIGHLFADREMNDFFYNLTRDTMAYRKQNNIVKHDFIDLLMDIRDNPDKMADIELTDRLLAAQLYSFFLGGFETTSSTISFALYELAINQQIQDKLRAEITEEMSRTGGVLEYEGINGMKYLDMVFRETLRKHPVATFVQRQAVQDYTFVDASRNKLLTIEKGRKVWIPIYAIHRDSKYYPKPEVFDPERFTEEAVRSRHPMAYLPFGQGPRNCIGIRFGVMQTKVGILKILNRYRVEVCDKTQVPYEINPKAHLLAPKYGIHLKFVKCTEGSDRISGNEH